MLLILGLATAPISGEPGLFELPTPDGWAEETIPFPLEFAPELEYEGVEELRFAPGMFDADSPELWTYAFVWWVPENTPVTGERLSSDLESYFRGLSAAVAGKGDFEAGEPDHGTELERHDHHSNPVYEGTAGVWDAFSTRAPLTLNVRVEVLPCHQAGRQAILFELSPQPRDHPVWHTLAWIRQEFSCLG